MPDRRTGKPGYTAPSSCEGSGAGIGGGGGGNGGAVYISGGSVYASNLWGISIGAGLNASDSGTLQNNSSAKAPVYLTTMTLRDTAGAAVGNTLVSSLIASLNNSAYTYGTRDMSEKTFTEHYKKWCKRKGYHFSCGKAPDLYASSCGHFTTLPKNDNTKLLLTSAAGELTAAAEILATIRAELIRLAKLLPESETVHEGGAVLKINTNDISKCGIVTDIRNGTITGRINIVADSALNIDAFMDRSILLVDLAIPECYFAGFGRPQEVNIRHCIIR